MALKVIKKREILQIVRHNNKNFPLMFWPPVFNPTRSCEAHSSVVRVKG